MTLTDDALDILTALRSKPLTCRELTVKLCGTLTGRAVWRIAGIVDRLHAGGLIVRCGLRDGRPVYTA